jgi:hypothetical protein
MQGAAPVLPPREQASGARSACACVPATAQLQDCAGAQRRGAFLIGDGLDVAAASQRTLNQWEVPCSAPRQQHKGTRAHPGTGLTRATRHKAGNKSKVATCTSQPGKTPRKERRQRACAHPCHRAARPNGGGPAKEKPRGPTAGGPARCLRVVSLAAAALLCGHGCSGGLHRDHSWADG